VAEAHRPLRIEDDRVHRADQHALHAVVAQHWIDPVHDSEGLRLADRTGRTCGLAHTATDAAGEHLERHRSQLSGQATTGCDSASESNSVWSVSA
jgi:hypothetical protein